MMSAPDWHRLFSKDGHRWTMGVRRGELSRFFQPCDCTGEVCAERARWLAEDPTEYAALLPEAAAALPETVRLAQSLGTTLDATSSSPNDQLLALGGSWEADFAWMHPDGNGTHRLVGGVVCFPSSWSLREKLGQPMAEVHAPVPGLNDRLARQIESLFARQAPNDVWVRDNANFSRDDQLNYHPSLRRKRLDSHITPAEFWVRIERQLLLKLPESGSILFGIRVETYPFSGFLADPPLARQMADYLASMSPAAAAYKGLTEARPRVIEWLRQCMT
jgi:hypothetical protein